MAVSTKSHHPQSILQEYSSGSAVAYNKLKPQRYR